MTDIFFSYRSVDRERVRPIRDAFAKEGFEVFWDQEVPSGADWDTWIRQHLSKSKCAVVFWSAASVESDNVRHEATVARRQGKLITVLLEPLSPDQFPMGFYSQQAINLVDWKSDFDHAEWHKLTRDIEIRLTPPWMQRRIYEFEAELVAERARREALESRDKVLQAQIAKEVLAQDDLRRRIIQSGIGQAQVGAKLSRPLSLGNPAFYLISVVSALLIGFGAHRLIWFQGPTAELPYAPMVSIGPRTPATTIFPSDSPISIPSATGRFTIRRDVEAYGDASGPYVSAQSIAACEQHCLNSLNCKIFTYARTEKSCFSYSEAKLRPSSLFDAGVRN